MKIYLIFLIQETINDITAILSRAKVSKFENKMKIVEIVSEK